MLNFKNFILQDARSHPELNPKISIKLMAIDLTIIPFKRAMEAISKVFEVSYEDSEGYWRS